MMNLSSWRSSATVVVNWAAVEYDDDDDDPEPEEEERLLMLWRLDEFVAFDDDADLLDEWYEWCEDNDRNEVEVASGDW